MGSAATVGVRVRWVEDELVPEEVLDVDLVDAVHVAPVQAQVVVRGEHGIMLGPWSAPKSDE